MATRKYNIILKLRKYLNKHELDKLMQGTDASQLNRLLVMYQNQEAQRKNKNAK